jgi:hypothetical protein
MVREVGEFARAAAEILVLRRALKAGSLGDGPEQRRRRAAAERVADHEGSVGVDTTGEFAVRGEGIEQHGEIARPLPPCQETLGAKRFGCGVAVMVDANGDETAPGQIAGEPVEVHHGAAGAVRQQHDRIALAASAQAGVAGGGSV